MGAPLQADRPPRRPKLSDFGKAIMRCSKLGIRTMIPARVVTYNPATQKADIQPQHNIVLNNDDGEQELLPAVIPSCPVAWPSAAAGTAYLTFPLAPADPGYLLMSDRSLERWLAQGVPVDPGSTQAHNTIDGVFHPQLRPTVQPIVPPTSATHTVLEGPLINIGALAVSPLVKGTELALALNTYAGAITAANGTLALLGTAWAGLPGANAVAFSAGFAPWATATTAAQTALSLAVAASLSVKGFVQ